MNLENEKLIGINEVHLLDSLNASLLEIKIKNNENTVIPNTDDLFIYVDQNSKENITENRKTYLFNLNSSLKNIGEISDEFHLKIVVENNDAIMKATVKRMVGTTEEGNYALESPVLEELEGYPLTLFEGENYIYTNYENATIELVYPQDNEFNRRYLNNTIYCGHKLSNSGEFCLDDIYFKDAFTKTEDKLNIEVNNANIDCLTSKNNKFSLDKDENLVVNSIAANYIVGSTINDNQDNNIVGEIVLENNASIMKIDNLDALNDGGVYEFLAICYTNSNTATNIQVKINDLSTGYHHSYINSTGALTSSGSMTSRSNYVQNTTSINEYLQTNGSYNVFPVIIEGRMYISENSDGQKKVNYTLRFYRTVQGGQSIWLGGGVFSQNFENINSLSLSLANANIQFAKGSKLTVFNPLKGLQGAKGEKGDTGATGPSNNLVIGSVTSGDVASATITGESPNQILNLVLPKGDAGEDGGNFTESDVQALIDNKLGTIYPVGSIYMSVTDTNPSTLFGGVWEQIKDTFLLGAGDKYAVGSTGGESEHKLTIDEMPLHGHNFIYGYGWTSGGDGGQYSFAAENKQKGYSGTNEPVRPIGGDQPHNNMPPYLAVYMWKRIS